MSVVPGATTDRRVRFRRRYSNLDDAMADTVSPARRASYTVEAPKMIPKMAPRMIALSVNSGTFRDAETKGSKFFSGAGIGNPELGWAVRLAAPGDRARAPEEYRSG